MKSMQPKRILSKAEGDLNPGRVYDWLIFLHSSITG